MNNTNITDDWPTEEVDWPLIIQDIIFLIIGFTGNVCLIFIALRYKNMRTVPNYLITNLAVVDLVYICLYLPAEITFAISAGEINRFVFHKSDAHCLFYKFILNVFLVVSIFTLTALSIDRYLAVSKPLACRSLRSGRRRLWAVVLGIVVIWAAALLNSIPVVHFVSLDYSGRCGMLLFQEGFQEYLYFSVVIILLIPTIIISVSYCCTAKNLLKSNRLLEGQSAIQVSPRQRRQRLRLAIAIIVIVVVFVSTWSLNYGLDVLFFVNEAQHYMKYDEQINDVYPFPAVNVLRRIGAIMIRINAVINPIILFVVSSAHRRHFKLAFCCCFQSGKNDDRKQWMRLNQNTSITMQSLQESDSKKSRTGNARVTVDHDV